MSKKIIVMLIVLVSAATCWAITADHKKFEILHQDFATGPDVTAACLSCHTEAAKEFHETIHWTWFCPKAKKLGKEVGKNFVINNFCVAVPSNEPRCTSCHAGYGWKDNTFDFSIEENVDCLVCHDQTGTYKKFPTGAGHPAYVDKKFGKILFKAVDLSYVAQNVGKSKRSTCGACHFYGGGGEGVKHGNLDATLVEPDRNLDVHMDAKGLNFNCIDCHTAKNHEISGRCYSIPAGGTRELASPVKDPKYITCESCHSKAPHSFQKMNDHVDRVACQTCHIPSIKGKATKSWWDWSKAGQFKDGVKSKKNLIVKKDEHGNMTYHTKKGEFKWANPGDPPEYGWFNGSANFVLVGDKIDPTQVVKINSLNGSEDDPDSRIWPLKVHRGKQPFDPVNNTFVVPKLFGPKGTGSYWTEYDWKKAVQAGMDYLERPFSGEIDFVETAMYWPLTHMVAPKEESLSCDECHSKNGRLANLTTFYLPGRDVVVWVDRLGWIVVYLALIGVVVHGVIRIFTNK